MQQIIMPRYITEVEIENIIEEFNNPEYSTRLDFSRTEFISPYAAIILTQLIERVTKKQDKKVHLVLCTHPNKVKPCMYILARIGFFENLPKGIKCYPYQPKPRGDPKGKNDAILEVTKINKQSFDEIMDKVNRAIISNTNYPKDHKNDICIMVSEMIQNIFYHSQAQKSGIIAVQKFARLNYMQMIIADSGIGIPESIRKSKEYENSQLNDSEAIIEAVKKGVSSFGKEEDRGEGLAKCVELANKHKASLFIRSNNGFASITFKSKRGFYAESPFLAGTQIFVNFPC